MNTQVTGPAAAQNPQNILTVGEQTKAYIDCLVQIDALWGSVCDALELNYHTSDAERIMNDEYNKVSRAVREFIEHYMCISISENINARYGFSEI
jgi:hypothetical protein